MAGIKDKTITAFFAPTSSRGDHRYPDHTTPGADLHTAR